MAKIKFSRLLSQNKPLYVYVIWIFWFGLLYFFILGFNPTIIYKHEVKKNFMFVFPQGWGFFTRSPREAMVDAYKEENGNLNLVTVLNSSSDNYFGLSRNSRVAGMEMSEVINHVSNVSWKNGKGALKAPSTISDTIKLSRKLTHFKPGVYVLHQYKVVPFAWVKQHQEKYAPYLVAKVYISEELDKKTNILDMDIPIKSEKNED
jgi:antimicrobial peptide system SdpA family protein